MQFADFIDHHVRGFHLTTQINSSIFFWQMADMGQLTIKKSTKCDDGHNGLRLACLHY